MRSAPRTAARTSLTACCSVEPGRAWSTAEQMRVRSATPVAPPSAEPEMSVVAPTPAMAVDCKDANKLPCATSGIVDCHAAAHEPAAGPTAEKPAMDSTRGVSTKAAPAPSAPDDAITTAAQSGDTCTPALVSSGLAAAETRTRSSGERRRQRRSPAGRIVEPGSSLERG
eukprot:3941235-Rhodomonas_salina.2